MKNKEEQKHQGFSVVKPKEKKADRAVIGGIIAVTVIIFGAIGYWIFGVEKGRTGDIAANTEQREVQSEVMNEKEKSVVLGTTNDVSVTSDNTPVSSGTVAYVDVAVLADPDLFDYPNNVVQGCDAVVMVQEAITPTPRVLNAALWTLFNREKDYGFTPGNFIATQDTLTLQGATIDDGLARVYLNGSVGPINGVCDIPRIETQIAQTALQFPTVSAVQIFLNDEILEVE